MDEFNELRKLVDECISDVEKASNGNKLAGTRVRKSMQQIKKCAQQVRKKIIEIKNGPSS